MLFTVVAIGNELNVYKQVYRKQSEQELDAAPVPSWQDFIGGRLNLKLIKLYNWLCLAVLLVILKI